MESLADKLLAINSFRKPEPIDLSEWWGELASGFAVRVITGTERDLFESAMYETRGGNARLNMRNLRARLVVLALVDREHKRVFPSNDYIESLGNQPAPLLDAVFDVAMRINKMRKEDVEELAGNFPKDGGATSGSPSPSVVSPSANS